MHAVLLTKGIVIGISIAAPVGPIGVLCIRHSLRDGMAMGLISGLGAATADAAYGCVAGFGLTAISGFLLRRQSWIGLIGGALLCYLGVRTFLSMPAKNAAPKAGGTSALSVYASTLVLTLAKPPTLLLFAVVFAAFGVGASVDHAAAGFLVLGVFLGSALWWLVLSASVSLVRDRVNTLWVKAVNRVSGAVLTVFGIYALTRW
jgi:threonine/homoserine/homoserine lactone efflux protein